MMVFAAILIFYAVDSLDMSKSLKITNKQRKCSDLKSSGLFPSLMPLFIKDHALVTYFSDPGYWPIRDRKPDLLRLSPHTLFLTPGKHYEKMAFFVENYQSMSFNIYKNQNLSP